MTRTFADRDFSLTALEPRLMLYALYGTQWASPDISASFVPDGTPLDGGHSSALFAYLDARFPTDTWQREFARALQTWAQYTPLNFHFVSDDGSAQGAAGSVQGDSRFGDIRLSARATDSLGFAWSPNPTTRGGDLTVSTSYELHIGSMFDLYSLLLHESGHSLGMAHSADPDAIMLTSTTRVWNDLGADDIAGIRALYGARLHDAFDAAGRNDSFASATRLNSDGSGRIAVTADLTSLGDVDYYSVTAPTGTDGTLSVSIDARGLSLLAPAVRVYDASGNLVASASAGDAYGTVASVTVGGLIAGQKYFIVADGATADPFGMGAYRLNAQFGGATLPALAAPSNLVGRDVSSSQVALNWSDNSNSENGFKVLRSSNGGVTWNEVAVTAANATSYRDDAAAAGMAYQYRVLAFNTSTVSPPSNIASVLTAPAAPTGLSAWALSQSQVSLVWGNVTGESGFRVERSTDGVTGWTQIASLAADETTFLDSGLAAGTTYYYRVLANNSGGTSDASAVASATTAQPPATVPAPAPVAPTNLTAYPSRRNKMSLAWTDNATDEAGYLVYRSTDGIAWTQVAVLGADSTSWVDGARKRNITYSYYVVARNAAGRSEASNVVTY